MVAALPFFVVPGTFDSSKARSPFHMPDGAEVIVKRKGVAAGPGLKEAWSWNLPRHTQMPRQPEQP